LAQRFPFENCYDTRPCLRVVSTKNDSGRATRSRAIRVTVPRERGIVSNSQDYGPKVTDLKKCWKRLKN